MVDAAAGVEAVDAAGNFALFDNRNVIKNKARGWQSPGLFCWMCILNKRYAGCNSRLRSAMISVWMLPGTGEYLHSSIVKVP